MIDCPECGESVRGFRCRCGWVAPQAKPQRSNDTQYGQCEWVSGERCHHAGVFARGGQYYCRAHDNCADPILGAQIVDQSTRDISRPDYSFNARRNASMDAVRREMEAWHTRLEAK